MVRIFLQFDPNEQWMGVFGPLGCLVLREIDIPNVIVITFHLMFSNAYSDFDLIYLFPIHPGEHIY